MPRLSNVGERYGRFMAAAPSPEAARRRIVECARRHGTAPAARMSGAHPSTVQRLLRRADAGRDLADGAGRDRLSARDRGRIVAAKRAHPTEGAGLIARNGRVPWSRRTIFRVLREAGLSKKIRVPARDPDHWLRRHEFLCLLAEIEFCLGWIARLKGATGRLADTDGPLRRVARAQRRMEWWRREKARREARARAGGDARR